MNHIRSYLNRSGRGQSLVEFTILLPVLLMMLSGLIEFGFLLNTYLDIIDAAREAARFAASDDPTIGAPTDLTPNFWNRAWRVSRGSLVTGSDARINWNSTDPTDCTGVNGDIVVSAFSVVGTSVVERWPALYGDAGAANCAIWGVPPSTYSSKLTTPQVEGILSGLSIPTSGFIVVEIYYEYNMILGLPWITAFVPDPIVLYAYTIMPNTYVEPTP